MGKYEKNDLLLRILHLILYKQNFICYSGFNYVIVLAEQIYFQYPAAGRQITFDEVGIMNDILLVDDEEAVLQSLSIALDWSEYGFAHVRTAHSAKDALHIMKEHPVDLILLDIQMPEMTGLEMLKIIRTKYPETHCVLISAYSKFEYAREALRLNVENYLLKPIDINELRETISHAAENIARASSSSHNLFKRNMLERWLYGRITNDELIEHSQYTHYNVLLRYYYAVILRLADNASSALHLLSEALPHGSAAYTLLQDSDTGILLLGGHDISDSFIEYASGTVTAAYPGVRIICGSRAFGSGDVSKSLADARHALEYARLAGYTGYLSFDRVNWNLLPPARLTELNDLMQLAPSDRQIQDFIARIVGDHASMQSNYQELYAQICLAMIHMLEKPDLKPAAPLPLTAPCNLQQFEAALAEAIRMLNSSKLQGAQNISPIIQRVIRYIRDNLSGSISIKHFCEQTNMNATYIGRLFREELGMYFSEYVSEQRINKAKLLLENTTYSVGDIARQVGIYDVSYFVQCFKKKERISPMKYRQQLKDLTPLQNVSEAMDVHQESAMRLR